MKKSLSLILLLLLTSIAMPALAEPLSPKLAWQRDMKPLKMRKVARPAPIAAPVVAPLPSMPVSERPKAPVIKYLGSLQRGNERYVFAEVNGQVYSVRSGGDLAGLYQLVALEGHEAKFVYLPTHENYLVYMD